MHERWFVGELVSFAEPFTEFFCSVAGVMQGGDEEETSFSES